MTIMQLMVPREGLEGEEEMPKKEEEVLVTDKEEVTEMPADVVEEKPAAPAAEPAPMEAKMPAEAKPEKAIAKAAPIITTDEEFELLKAQLMA
jgi:hypothetical protein